MPNINLSDSTEILNIGLIAGDGRLPLEVAINCRERKIPYVIVSFKDRQDLLDKQFDYKIFSLGQIGAIIDYFRQHGVKHIIFAGAIKRPNFSLLKVDFTGAILLAKIIKKKSLGDDALLRIVAEFIERKGFHIISANKMLTCTNKVQNFSIMQPTTKELSDIDIGLKVIETMGRLDIGQAVVIENGYVLGVEAAEGTDNLIARCAALRKKSKGGVLIKAMKPDQDQRFDMPTIGPDTICNLIKHNYAGVAIKANEVIILDPAATYEIANKGQIFIFMM